MAKRRHETIGAATNDTQLAEAVALVRSRYDRQPRAAIILGTGLGALGQAMQVQCTLPYHDIPHFPRSTALSHRGRLLCGTLAGVPVITMDGRCHLYEGYSRAQIGLPIKLLRALGAELLIVSNASGGINPHFNIGDIMIIEDHINLTGHPPGKNPLPHFAGRMPRSCPSPYTSDLIRLALGTARRLDTPVQQGVYVAMTGPNYETRAEYRMLRKMGGDVAGMSTVPEVEDAALLGMRVLAFSIVANVARPDHLDVVSGPKWFTPFKRLRHGCVLSWSNCSRT